MNSINKQLTKYIENNILPLYEKMIWDMELNIYNM